MVDLICPANKRQYDTVYPAAADQNSASGTKDVRTTAPTINQVNI